MRILVTGSSGFLGSALVKRLLIAGYEVRGLGRSESRQALLAAEVGSQSAARFLIGDIRDRDRLVDAMWHCDAVIHCAALKRVDSVSSNPMETRKTNVEGSANVTAAAARTGVRKVLMIGSDKGCSPTNHYGASKAQMEHEAIASNAVTAPRGTRIACTRYGNVLASTGSVIGIWRQAIARGEPLLITDPEATRFWLTVDQAVDVILEALQLMQGGEVFVPVLPAMRLGDLAEAVAPGYPQRIIGMRPGGEKRDELLLNPEEVHRTVAVNDHLYVVKPSLHSWRADEWIDGEPLPPEFCYRSDLVGWRLDVPTMRKMLEAIP